jgi:hypothetical protein
MEQVEADNYAPDSELGRSFDIQPKSIAIGSL